MKTQWSWPIAQLMSRGYHGMRDLLFDDEALGIVSSLAFLTVYGFLVFFPMALLCHHPGTQDIQLWNAGGPRWGFWITLGWGLPLYGYGSVAVIETTKWLPQLFGRHIPRFLTKGIPSFFKLFVPQRERIAVTDDLREIEK